MKRWWPLGRGLSNSFCLDGVAAKSNRLHGFVLTREVFPPKVFEEMKKFATWFLAIFAVMTVASSVAQAASVDITVNDGNPNAALFGTDLRPGGILEWGETEQGTVANNSWDLRAFSFDINSGKLAFVSGFDPRVAQDDIGIGDIFINTNGAIPLHTFSGSNPNDYLNTAAGYEFAINLTNPSNGSLAYQVVELSPASVLRAATFAVTQASSPATLQAAPGNETVISSGNFTVTTKTGSELLTELGIVAGTNGGTNYVTTFDLPAALLAAIAPGGATFRLTQDCGNDLLVGHVDPSIAAVPETSTWVMGFLALGAVVLVARRKASLAS